MRQHGAAIGVVRRATDCVFEDPANNGMLFRRDLAAFRPVAERAIELNPMDGSSVAFMGLLIALAGDWERGRAIADPASALNPQHAGWHRLLPFFDAYRQGDDRAALAAALRLDMPYFFQGPAARAAAYGQLGELQLARRAVADLLRLWPDFATGGRAYYERWQGPELVERLMEGYRKAGLSME